MIIGQLQLLPFAPAAPEGRFQAPLFEIYLLFR